MGAVGRRLAAGLGLLLLIGLAWAARTIDAPTIFTDRGIRPAGPDAYYHLRRTAFSFARFPRVLEHDRYLNFPHGGDVIWSPGLDWSTAALARLWLGPGAEAPALDRLALTLPPLLGVLTVLCTAVYAARRFGLAGGLVSGALLAVLPGHALYSRLGMFDHHALEGLFTLAFLSASGATWSAAIGGSGLALPALGLAATAALAFLFWPGLLLQLALVDAVIVAAVFLGRPARWRGRLAGAGAAAHALAALALLPWWGREWSYWGDFAPVVLGTFQPWLLACLAVVLAVGALGARARPLARCGAGAAAALVLAVLSAVAFPDLLEVPARMWSWLARTDDFQAQVSESLPLLAAGRHGRLATAAQLSSLLGLASPLVLVLHARGLLRAPARHRGEGSAAPATPPEGWLLFALACGLGLAALAQRRFVNAFSVPLALLYGWLLGAAIAAWLRSRVPGQAARGLSAAAAAIVGIASLTPIAAVYGPALARREAHAQGRPMRLAPDVWRRHELHSLAAWLRQATPPTSGYLDPGVAPEYGILAHWSDGHVIEAVAQRPTVVSNFGNDLGEANWRAAARYFSAGEAEASALLDRLKVRYVILEWRPQPPLQEYGPGSMIARGFFGDGSEQETSQRRHGGVETRVAGSFPAFERHRLIQESAPKPWAPSQPFFKVYEHVAGARVEGRAPPGALVRFALGLTTPRGRSFTWRSHARAGADGRYRIRLPYSTRGAPPAVRPAAAYRVAAAGLRASLAVDEAAVQEGRRVRGPDLSAARP